MTYGAGQVRRVLLVAPWRAPWGSGLVGDESALNVAPAPGEAGILRHTFWVAHSPLTPFCGCGRPSHFFQIGVCR